MVEVTGLLIICVTVLALEVDSVCEVNTDVGLDVTRLLAEFVDPMRCEVALLFEVNVTVCLEL